jgi:hypothetical protein
MQKSLFDYRAFRRRGEDEANFGEESRPAPVARATPSGTFFETETVTKEEFNPDGTVRSRTVTVRQVSDRAPPNATSMRPPQPEARVPQVVEIRSGVRRHRDGTAVNPERQSLTYAARYRILRYADSMGQSAASARFSVAPSTLSTWRKERKHIEQDVSASTRP